MQRQIQAEFQHAVDLTQEIDIPADSIMVKDCGRMCFIRPWSGSNDDIHEIYLATDKGNWVVMHRVYQDERRWMSLLSQHVQDRFSKD